MSIARRAVEDVANGTGVVLDMRRDDEWELAPARGARHWDMQRLQRGERPDVPPGTRIYTYCQAGTRAGRAVAMLHDMGFDDVVLLGGLSDWRIAGGEVE